MVSTFGSWISRQDQKLEVKPMIGFWGRFVHTQTLPTTEISSGKNAHEWVSIVLYLKE